METVVVTKVVVVICGVPVTPFVAVAAGVAAIVAVGAAAALAIGSSSSNSDNKAPYKESSEKGSTTSTASDGGNGDDNNGGKENDKENQHVKDDTSEDEESDKENQSKKDKNKVSKRKVTTAWLKPVFYPEAPVRKIDPSQENFIIRLSVPLMRLESVGENGFYPRQHLLYRIRMFFYGYGRLQKLCSELGLKVSYICKFGTSVYKDSRVRMVKKSEYVHAAHVFPITDFDFDMIRACLRKLHCNETQERINQIIHEHENILMNMVGHTDYVHRDFNMSGGVGRALDIFLKNFIQTGGEDITSGNIEVILNSLTECLSSSITKTTRREIEATITLMLSADVREWINYYRMGLNGQFDYHFNVTRRFIDEEYRDRCTRSKSRDRDKKKDEDKDSKKQK